MLKGYIFGVINAIVFYKKPLNGLKENEVGEEGVIF